MKCQKLRENGDKENETTINNSIDKSNQRRECLGRKGEGRGLVLASQLKGESISAHFVYSLLHCEFILPFYSIGRAKTLFNMRQV